MVLNSPFQMYVKFKRANKWQEEPKFKHSKVEMVHKMAWQRMWWNNWKTWDNEILSEQWTSRAISGSNAPYRFNLFFSLFNLIVFCLIFDSIFGIEWRVESGKEIWCLIVESICLWAKQILVSSYIQNSLEIMIFR